MSMSTPDTEYVIGIDPARGESTTEIFEYDPETGRVTRASSIAEGGGCPRWCCLPSGHDQRCSLLPPVSGRDRSVHAYFERVMGRRVLPREIWPGRDPEWLAAAEAICCAGPVGGLDEAVTDPASSPTWPEELFPTRWTKEELELLQARYGGAQSFRREYMMVPVPLAEEGEVEESEAPPPPFTIVAWLGPDRLTRLGNWVSVLRSEPIAAGPYTGYHAYWEGMWRLRAWDVRRSGYVELDPDQVVSAAVEGLSGLSDEQRASGDALLRAMFERHPAVVRTPPVPRPVPYFPWAPYADPTEP